MRNKAIILSFLLSLLSNFAFAADDLQIKAIDTPDDAGNSLVLQWPPYHGSADSMFYEISAWSFERNEWQKILGFKADNMWQQQYPEVFGIMEDERGDHAVKITMAPPTLAKIKELTNKAGETLKGTNEKLESIAADIEEVKAEFDKYSLDRNTLESRIAALSSLDSDREKRVALTRELDLMNRSQHRMALLYDRQKALIDQQKRLRNFDVPDSFKLQPGHEYLFKVSLKDKDRIIASGEVSATPYGNWFNGNRLNNLIIALLLAGLILYYTNRARKNPEQIFVRRIAGLEAVDEAIGRATEMGKPIFFVHGLASISTISTVAAINILGKIAEKVAEYGTEFKVTNRDPVVLAVSQETVKESYLRSGRPDLYSEDNVFYVSQDQFSYATGVEGMFLREKPASNFFFGYYYAEALLLTETGSHIGAIQIAGTDSYTQLPFFITTCDYTLMGEELYAASAYMSREPKLLASLKAQDITKGILLTFMMLGVALSTFGVNWLLNWTKSF